jgi:NAD(P)-dependent dehydrogenase (short-subunit alcohol dehydrogenase family)
MTIADRAVLVTGANRGIGQALVDEALRRGASRVYAGTRRPLAVSDGRVTPLTLDVTNPAYSISKAAAFSLSQSLRALLAGQGVTVHDVLAGPVDTDMSRDLDAPKASPESVARATFDGVDNGDEGIFPDPMSESMADSWRSGAAKALERQYAALTEGST